MTKLPRIYLPSVKNHSHQCLIRTSYCNIVKTQKSSCVLWEVIVVSKKTNSVEWPFNPFESGNKRLDGLFKLLIKLKICTIFFIKLNWIECNHLQPNWIKFEWNKVIDVWSPMLEFKSGATFHMKLLKVNWTLWSQFYHETGLNKAQMNREINQESMISREMNIRTKKKEFKFSTNKGNL